MINFGCHGFFSKLRSDVSECLGDVCANGECVSNGARCNQLQDCTDGSDEAGCSCADFLRAQSHHNKICDTIVDCADYSDEYNCGKIYF